MLVDRMPESASRGVYLVPGGSGPGGGCLVRGGVCLLRGEGGVVSQHALRQTPPPPVNRMTDRCKNITLATTSLRPVKISGYGFLSIDKIKHIQ